MRDAIVREGNVINYLPYWPSQNEDKVFPSKYEMKGCDRLGIVRQTYLDLRSRRLMVKIFEAK